MAAGDIVCDPGSTQWNGGMGNGIRCRHMATSDLLLAGAPDVVMPLGDLQYENGTYTKFMQGYDPSWGRVKSITRPVIGNHEYGEPPAHGYFDYFNGIGIGNGPAGERGKGWYSFDLGAWHIVVLNSNCNGIDAHCGVGSPQETWLRQDLAASDAACTLAAFHHPRFSSGPHGGDPKVGALFQALYDGGVDVALNGHEHLYERFDPQNPLGHADPINGIRQFTVGTGGKELLPFSSTVAANSVVRDSSSPGVLSMTLTATGYSWQFVPVPGFPLADAGTGTCHGSS